MRLRSNACSASGGVYDLSRISPLSLCLATSLGGQTEQREEPRAVARELGAELCTRVPDEGGNQHAISMQSACNQGRGFGAELCTRMPLETPVVDPMPEPDLIWIEMRRGPRAPARHLAPALWNAIRCCPALRCNILWPSEALRGTQRHSEALRGQQGPSEALGGTQRHSEALRGTH